MKTVIHKIDNEFFEGTVEITVPSYPERLRNMKILNFVVTEGKVESNGDTLEKIALGVEMITKNVKAVSIKVKKTGEMIDNLDDFGIYAEASPILSELVAYLSRGMTLSSP